MSREGGALLASCFLFGYYHDVRCSIQSNQARISRPHLSRLGIVDAHKINRCLVFLHALPFFARVPFWPCACSQLATTCLPPLPPASMCVAHDHASTWHIGAVVPRNRCRRRVPGRAAWGSVARRKEHAIGRRRYFLLCELAIATSNKRQPALRPFGCLFSLSLSCYLALLLLLLYFDFQLLRKYLLFFH